jgi:hypothetical protein
MKFSKYSEASTLRMSAVSSHFVCR